MGRERMAALHERLLRAQAWTHERAAARLDHARTRLLSRHPQARLQQLTQRNADLQRRLLAAWERCSERRRQRLAELARALHAVSPLDVLKRGYAILFDESGNVLRSAQNVTPGARVHARLADGELPLKVDQPVRQ
jgi:exodeoxyribonuclease VII large subunit